MAPVKQPLKVCVEVAEQRRFGSIVVTEIEREEKFGVPAVAGECQIPGANQQASVLRVQEEC